MRAVLWSPVVLLLAASWFISSVQSESVGYGELEVLLLLTRQ